MTRPLPTILHLGSGKSFLPEALNVDISPLWRPDIVADLNEPFPLTEDTVYRTERFGPVRLAKDSMQRIVAMDVLEHIRELPTAMTSCLELLATGGELHIQVPYDLSLGAWSDPTHVRAFNERSWTYYTEWPWYFGWREARFQLTHLDFELGPLGHELAKQGKGLDELLHVPRAVNAMRVVLVKSPFTAEERVVLADYYASRGQHGEDMPAAMVGAVQDR